MFKEVEPTSSLAYKRICEEGLLSKRKLEVYDLLARYGPLTGRELFEHAKREYKSASLRDTFQQRLSELEERGVAEKIGERICKSSGQKAKLWAWRDGLPKEPKEKSKQSVWVLFVQHRDEKVRVFKTKEAATTWKFKNQKAGVLHEAIVEK